MDWKILKYVVTVLIELAITIFGLYTVLTIYDLYQYSLIFYFLLYNIIGSIFSIVHFIKIFKDMINEELKDIVFVKCKTFLMIVGFIWGIVILEQHTIIKFYQNNFPRVYISFVNYFIMSSVSIVYTIYKILLYFYEKRRTVNYSILPLNVPNSNDVINFSNNKTTGITGTTGTTGTTSGTTSGSTSYTPYTSYYNRK